MIKTLRRTYPCRYGAPLLNQVDTRIFSESYFTHCMQCNFCNDSCCSYGVDVDVTNVKRILDQATELEAFTGKPRGTWFKDGWIDDPEFPGGKYTRARVVDGRCVFLNRSGRGCLIHSYCVAKGIDYHELKPMVSILYPLTFDDGLLHPSDEIDERLLVCIDQGPSLYRGVRDELGYYFSDELVHELDLLEAEGGPHLSPP